ncbi:MAG TPA: cytochromesubunit B of the bc complex-like protein [Rubrobacter sp.]|nr:cytochromesubunit B of the bc complex-like protein [Rubrobacter sp.]
MTQTNRNVDGECASVGHTQEENRGDAFPGGFTMREFFRQAVWRPEADAQRGEEEQITEENVYDSYDETIPFFPNQILIEVFFLTLLLLIVTALSYLAPAPLTEPADTATVTYVPRPEWFFFFYEQMLIFFPGYALISFGAVVVPTIFVVLLYAVPWLDRQPGHDTRRRPFATVVGLLVVVVIVLNMLLAVSRVVNFPGG